MHIENTYAAPKRRFDRKRMLHIWRWPFLAAGFTCAVVNLAVGGKAWSLVVLWCLYCLWTNVFSLNMVDYNRVSQCVKMSVQVSILLFLIEVCLASGWAYFVLPIVGFGALITAGVLFFSDLRKQKSNVMPMLLLALTLLGICTVGGWFWETWSWPMIVMAAVSFALVAVVFVTRGGGLLADFRKYFHFK